MRGIGMKGHDVKAHGTKARTSAKRRRGAGRALAAATLALALAASGCSTGCSSGGAASGSAGDGEAARELSCGSTVDFYAESADPAEGWNGWELEYYGVAENLLKLTDDFDVEPWLALSCEQVDELTWTLELRDDVYFTNGEKMTAESVKACLERTYEQNARAAETLDIDSIEADGQTLTIVTAEPLASFENALCDPLFCVYYTGDDVDYAAYTPCTGPYRIEELVYEDYTVLVPNEDYWGGDPQLDRITLYTYFDADALTMALQTGEIQLIASPAASSIQTLADAEGYEWVSQTSTRADFIRFNMGEGHEVVANDAVRLAVAYCLDREGYAEVICGGTEQACYGVYSPQLPFGGTDALEVTVGGQDLEAAAAALDAAGVVDTDGDGVRELPDGTPCVIVFYNCSNYERFVSLADDLQSNLAQVGIELDIVTVDYWLQDEETYASADPDMTLDSYGMAPTGDAGYFISLCFDSEGSNNFGSYSNEELDALADELDATFDEDGRAELIAQISQIVLDDAAYIFVANMETSFLTDGTVSGFAVAPSEYYFITAETTVE